LDEEEDDEPLPRKTIINNEKWVGQMNNGKETNLDKIFLRKNFGDAFAHELKSIVRGFVDVPVGDFKPSHLHLNPHFRGSWCTACTIYSERWQGPVRVKITSFRSLPTWIRKRSRRN
jgi:hypothetical protein